MKLSDMINKKFAEDSASQGQMRVARAVSPGVSANQFKRSDDVVSKKSDQASKDVANQLKLFNFALTDFSKSNEFARMLELASKEMNNPEPDATALTQSTDFEDMSMLESKLETLKEFTSVNEIDNNILMLMMGGDINLTSLARQALKRIENDQGINKRFMPAIKKLLSHLTDILADAGVAGYKVIDNLHSTMSPEKHIINKQGDAGKSPSQPAEYEPSEEEILKYGIDNRIPTTTQDEKIFVADLIKKGRQKDLDKNKKKPDNVVVFGKKNDDGSNAQDSEKGINMNQQKLAASKEYNEKPINESLGYAMPSQDEDSERVTYSKTKKQGDATVSANADSMQELHDVLRLAGITLPKSDNTDEPEHDEPEHGQEQPEAEVCDCCGNEVVDGECGCGEDCPHCGGKPEDDSTDSKMMVISPNDAQYSTDKQVLVNYLKDKLKKSIS